MSARAVAPSKVYVIPQDALLSSYASLPEALLAMRRHVDATVDAPPPSTFAHLSPRRATPSSGVLAPR